MNWRDTNHDGEEFEDKGSILSFLPGGVVGVVVWQSKVQSTGKFQHYCYSVSVHWVV